MIVEIQETKKVELSDDIQKEVVREYLQRMLGDYVLDNHNGKWYIVEEYMHPHGGTIQQTIKNEADPLTIALWRVLQNI